jgi:hypothetical protein
MVRDTGEKVMARSPTSCVVKHFEDSWGGPITPPVWVLLMTCHRPGSMPSPNAAEIIKAQELASPNVADAADRQSLAIALRLRIILVPRPLLSEGNGLAVQSLSRDFKLG